jgi:hypothetical protein
MKYATAVYGFIPPPKSKNEKAKAKLNPHHIHVIEKVTTR